MKRWEVRITQTVVRRAIVEAPNEIAASAVADGYTTRQIEHLPIVLISTKTETHRELAPATGDDQ